MDSEDHGWLGLSLCDCSKRVEVVRLGEPMGGVKKGGWRGVVGAK